MNIENVENLNNEDIFSLYDEIVESPDLISPHWLCFSNGYNDGELLMYWDWADGCNAIVDFTQRGTRANIGTPPLVYHECRTDWATWFPRYNTHASDSWAYTGYLCNSYCPHSCYVDPR